YTGQLYVDNQPLSLRMAFTGESLAYPAYENTVADFGTMHQGKTVLLRFRVGTDEAAGAPGWDLDSLQITGITNTPFAMRRLVTAMCVNKPPVANAGPNQTVPAGARVTLGGQATDGNDDPLTYHWTQSGGPPVTLDGAQSLT